MATTNTQSEWSQSLLPGTVTLSRALYCRAKPRVPAESTQVHVLGGAPAAVLSELCDLSTLLNPSVPCFLPHKPGSLPTPGPALGPGHSADLEMRRGLASCPSLPFGPRRRNALSPVAHGQGGVRVQLLCLGAECAQPRRGPPRETSARRRALMLIN